MVSIVLADKHELVRQGIRALLKAHSFNIIGEADTGLEALRLVENLKPALVIVELLLPCINGFGVIQQISSRFPTVRILVLSLYVDEKVVLQAFASGAHGYIAKTSTISHLIEGVIAVCAGKYYLSPPSDNLVTYFGRRQDLPADPNDKLTAREWQVLHLITEGYTSSAIAALLEISVRTVEVHRANLMHKLNLRTRSEILRYAIQHNLLLPELRLEEANGQAS